MARYAPLANTTRIGFVVGSEIVMIDVFVVLHGSGNEQILSFGYNTFGHEHMTGPIPVAVNRVIQIRPFALVGRSDHRNFIFSQPSLNFY